jgi:hypothetical protein
MARYRWSKRQGKPVPVVSKARTPRLTVSDRHAVKHLKSISSSDKKALYYECPRWQSSDRSILVCLECPLPRCLEDKNKTYKIRGVRYGKYGNSPGNTVNSRSRLGS